MPKKLTRLMSLLLCLVIFTGAVGCSGEKGASGQKVAVPEVQRAKAAVTHGKDREKTCSSQQCVPERVVVENNSLSFGDGFESNAAAATSWNKYAVDNNLTPEQKQAGLDKIAKGDMPDSTNITKVIVDGYQDGVMIAGAWYLGPAASAGKVLSGGLLGLAANSGYQVYDLNQPQNANKSWDYLGSATSFTTGMMAPGRGVLANTGIAMGGAFFTDGPNTVSLAGAALGGLAGGSFGKFAPVIVDKQIGKELPGFAYDIGGSFISEFTGGAIKDALKPSENKGDKNAK
ncbi:adhesin [Enterobacter sp. JBIWA003]|uniref:adhesin n=1 Tax=Enterobacter sp. JBIWA003 TaxID=2831890 RepID=UPI001CBFC425|nr:adhesin [Enterobacter sp. JBIWA003]